MLELFNNVLVLVLVFWMELVPSLGRELVECCLAEVREDVVEVKMTGGGGLGDPGGESSDSLASI